jgi:hypothetical protein
MHSRNTQSIVPVLVAIMLVTWLSTRFFRGVSTWPTNVAFAAPPADLAAPEDELGDFTLPRSKKTLATYYANLEEYKKLAMRPISPEVDVTALARQLRPLLIERLQSEPETAKIVAAYPAQIFDGLAEQTALMLARCAGMAPNKYLDLLGIGHDAALHVPVPVEQLDSFCEYYLPGVPIVHSAKDQDRLRTFFAKVYDVGDLQRNRSNNIVGWSNEPKAVLALLAESPYLGRETLDLCFVRINNAGLKFFRGGLLKGNLLFTGPVQPFVEPRGNDPLLLCSEIAFIVHTKGDDYYPIHFESYYDTKTRRWWLQYVQTCCSPRMATAAMRAF